MDGWRRENFRQMMHPNGHSYKFAKKWIRVRTDGQFYGFVKYGLAGGQTDTFRPLV